MFLDQVRNRYLKFFEKKGHVILPSTLIVPENDPTTLFTGSGMQPFLPYLLGEKHPKGTRLVNSQKCFRAEDIDEVGDNRHTTFFEMLGNWSLGDYFKKEQLPWVFEFLTKNLGIPPERLYITVFAGDKKNNLPKDTESAEIWKGIFKEAGISAKDVEIGTEEEGSRVGMQDGRIFYYGAKKNWWSRAGTPDKMPSGEPGGPDSEIFYRFSSVEHNPKFGKECHPNCDCGQFLEIGNSVFMQYRKKADGTFENLPKQNVDFGGGLERLTAVVDDNSDIFTIDVFQPIIKELEKTTNHKYATAPEEVKKTFGIIADHVRGAVFMIADGVMPGNKDKGYILKRLVRRALFKGYQFKITDVGWIETLADTIINIHGNYYPELTDRRDVIVATLIDEAKKFYGTLESGLKIFDSLLEKSGSKSISGEDAFVLFTTHGFPLELTEEIAKQKMLTVDIASFNELMKKHQDLSRAGSEGKFKGGLADTSAMSLRYHTATHLLNAALRQILGDHVMQKGSNITPERLRFDFPHPQKMTDEEKKKVEDLVNQKIEEDLPVGYVEMKLEDARKTGAIGAFGEKYPEVVKVYRVGDPSRGFFSQEFCGGPHVTHTGEIGKFKIVKEEAVAQGIRRIKAIVE